MQKCLTHSKSPSYCYRKLKCRCKVCSEYSNNLSRKKQIRFRKKNRAKGFCSEHPGRKPVRGGSKCQECVDKKKEWQDRVRKERKEAGVCRYHPNNKTEVGKIHCEDCLDQRRSKRESDYVHTIRRILETHGVGDRGCHKMIHPNMPEDLKLIPCWGKLWLEHPNGGGRKDGPDAIVRGIMTGKRNPKDYLILCRLHQIWNDNRGIVEPHHISVVDDRVELGS